MQHIPSRFLISSLARLIQRMLILLVQSYRLLLSPWLGSGCRFEPTCSMYALQALQTHGAARGSYLTLRRLARCHPWCEGGSDPVPAAGHMLETPATPAQKDRTSLFTSLVTTEKSSS